MRKILAAVLALMSAVAATPAAAQEGVEWRQSPVIFLPGLTDAGQASLVEGETIVHFPLRWVLSTRLANEVVLDIEGETLTLEEGTLLPMVQISNDNGLKYPRKVFCTRSRVAETREGTGFMGMMFGGMLNSLDDGQVCLEDSDKDGTLDHALALGEGDSILDLGWITPIDFEELLGESMGNADDMARLTLVRVGRNTIQVGFEIMQRGNLRNFHTFRSGRFSANSLNQFRYGEFERSNINLLGMLIELEDADRGDNRASLRWSPTVGDEAFVLIPTIVETRYGY